MPNSQTVKPIAFVAMPFRIKSTGLNAGQGPAHIDFDALWDQAIFPALEQLDYLPIRADNQDGSVIIKDMLEQLIYADLVLVDISIANGNVYYEAGIRHAARATGCVLMSADWARPLFDLGQIRQMRYPLQTENPSQSDYANICEAIVTSVPTLARSECPVHSLTNLQEQEDINSLHLRENTDLVFNFQTELRKCRLAYDDEAVNIAESLVDQYGNNPRTPMYVLRELVELVRDKLGWEKLLNLYNKLDQSARRDGFIAEQVALAKCKTGNPHHAIAEIEQLVASHGETPERIGLIAGRYKELFRNEDNPIRKHRWLELAISTYRHGMMLDLNQYYCASNLPPLLRIQGPSFDAIEANHIAIHVLNVCNRMDQMGNKDIWLNSTRLIMMFFTENYSEAKKLVQKVLIEDFASWELESTITSMTEIVDQIDEGNREIFAALIDLLTSRVSVTQETLINKILPEMNRDRNKFEKYQTILAREAVPGESIVSHTTDGREAVNIANQGDFVVQNQTDAKELYIVSKENFDVRYMLVEKDTTGWSQYSSLIEVLALEVDSRTLALLKQYDTFYIYAAWMAPQRVEVGDYLVAPLPGLGEIYRVGCKEFKQTYRLLEIAS